MAKRPDTSFPGMKLLMKRLEEEAELVDPEKTAVLTLRVPVSVKARVDEMAKSRRLAPGTLARMILEAALTDIEGKNQEPL